MKCAGILTLVPFEMFRPIFIARFFSRKVPNPRRYKFSPFTIDCLMVSIMASMVTVTVGFSIPVWAIICSMISALVISLMIKW